MVLFSALLFCQIVALLVVGFLYYWRAFKSKILMSQEEINDPVISNTLDDTSVPIDGSGSDAPNFSESKFEKLNYQVPDEKEDVFSSTTTISFVSPLKFTEKIHSVHVLTNGLDKRLSFVEEQQRMHSNSMLAMEEKLSDILGPLFLKLSDKVDLMISNAEEKLGAMIDERLETKTEAVVPSDEIPSPEGLVPSPDLTIFEEQISELNSKVKSLEDQLLEINENEMNKLKEMNEQIETLHHDKSDIKVVEKLEVKINELELSQSNKADLKDFENLSQSLESIEKKCFENIEQSNDSKTELKEFRMDLEKRIGLISEDLNRLTTETRAGVAAALEAATASADKAKELNKELEVKTTTSFSCLETEIANIKQQIGQNCNELNYLHGEVDHLNADHHHHDTEESERIVRVTQRQEATALRKKASMMEDTGSVRPGFLNVQPLEEKKPLDTATDDINQNNDNNVDDSGGIHRVAVADPLVVEEHRRLLRALVRKVNAQGRCLQTIVKQVAILDDRKAKAKAMQNDGIAVQCLSCLRPTFDSLPRLSEGQIPPSSSTNMFAEETFVDVKKTPISTKQTGFSFGGHSGNSRPKSAGKKRVSGTSNTTGPIPFPIHQPDTNPQKNGAGLIHGMTNGTGSGIFKIVNNNAPLTSAVAQHFPVGDPLTSPEKRIPPSEVLGLSDELYASLDEMEHYSENERDGENDMSNKNDKNNKSLNLSPLRNSAAPKSSKSRPQSASRNRPSSNKGSSNKNNSFKNGLPFQQVPIDIDSPLIDSKWKTEAELEMEGNEGWDNLM